MELERVRIGECLCPGAPHPEGDYVSLRPILDLRGGFRVKRRLLDLNQAAQVERIRSLYEKGGMTIKELAVKHEMAMDVVKDIVLGTGDYVEPKTGPVDRAEMEADLAEVYLIEGVIEWNLVSEEGPVPVNPQTIKEHLLNDYGRAEAAADRADDLYRPAVFDPLVRRALSSLPDTPTNGLTSPTNGHGPETPKRSKQSSTKSTQTASTTPTT